MASNSGAEGVAAAGRKTVLLVEDEAIPAMAEKANLESAGYDVVSAGSGEAAVAKALENPAIDIVLMDVDLGSGMDGSEAASRILAARDIPILFVSNHTEPDFVGRTEDISNYGYVVKDSGPTVLDASIKMAFRLFEARRGARESEDRFRSLYEHMIEGVALHELVMNGEGKVVDYRILEANPAFEEQLQIQRSKVEGRMSREAYGVDSPPYLDIYSRVVATGKPESFETFFAAMGKWFSVAAYRTGNGRFATVFEDITERKNREAALRESERLYRSLFDNMLDAFAYCRLVHENGIPVDFVHLAVNEAFSIITGFSQVVGRRMTDLIPGVFERDPEFLELFAKVARTGKPERRELFMRSLGKWFHISVYSPAPEHFVAIFDDVTEGKRSQAELRNSEVKLEAVLAAAAAGILAVDASGHVVHYNEKYRELWGVPPEVLAQGRDEELLDFVKLQLVDSEAFLARVEELYHSDREDLDIIPFKDGRVIERYSTPLVLDGNLSGRVWSFRDITERRKAEESIRRLLAEKELLLREVHHRIKNNMNTINGFLLLQADKARDPVAAGALVDAGTRVRGMMLLYDKLYLAKSFTNLAVRDYISPLVDDIVGSFPRGRSVRVAKNFGDFTLDVKRLQSLGVIVNELLTNIMKYAFSGREGGAVSVSLVAESGMVRLEVADDGIGMPADLEFARSPGFGLTLVEGMAGQLEGRVWKEAGPGTRIVLEFPQSRREMPTPEGYQGPAAEL